MGHYECNFRGNGGGRSPTIVGARKLVSGLSRDVVYVIVNHFDAIVACDRETAGKTGTR